MTVILYWLATGPAYATGTAASPVIEGAIIPTVLLCLILLCGSAFFSSSETALFGLQPQEIESMNGKGGQHVRKL